MEINVPLRRKDSEIETSPCIVKKTIELPTQLFEDFRQNLLSEYDFIQENIGFMYLDQNDISHCLPVLGEGRNDGILVESEGSSYARYSAFLPNARELLMLEQYPAFNEFHDRMTKCTDEYVKKAIRDNQEGMYGILTEDMEHDLSPGFFELHFLMNMLGNRQELLSVELLDDEIILQLKPEYIHEKKSLRSVSPEQFEIMCAKHLLWLYDEGGEQADFSHYDLSDMNLSHRNLNNALFIGTRLYGAYLDGAELCFADFTDANVWGCNAKNITADEATFKNSVIHNCDFSGSLMIHCNFSGADLTNTVMQNVRMHNACLDGATVPDTVFQQADTQNYSNDEQSWGETSDPVLSL